MSKISDAVLDAAYKAAAIVAAEQDDDTLDQALFSDESHMAEMRPIMRAALEAALPHLQPSPAGQVASFPWENFPAYLIDKCEGDTISEEGLQQALAAMAKDERYCAARQPVGQEPVTDFPLTLRGLIAYGQVAGNPSQGAKPSHMRDLIAQMVPHLKRLDAMESAPPAQAVVDGWSGWATQYPGKMPVLFGAREIAELNHCPEEGQRLMFLSEQTAPAMCRNCNGVGVIPYTSGQTPEQFEQGAYPCQECAPAPAVDLGQFFGAIQGAEDFIARYSYRWAGEGPHPNEVVTKLRELLALLGSSKAVQS